ncbi:hypothetical protein NLX83_20810 [Allokutzneria sp. A3M-2-11 16]|nr:hypothetical protein [Allokutzneria sp. A3M-2-11 16]
MALFNENADARRISTTAAEIGLSGAARYRLRDLWSKRTTTSTGAISADVPGHATVVLRVRKG